MSANIEEKVKTIISEKLELSQDKITMTASFIEDLKLDSLDIVELIMNLEETFDMSIPDEDAEKMKTVGDVVNYISTKSKATH
jgi:acyl carrier protein